MKKIIIVIYDSKAESFSNPSVTDNAATAIRDFKTIVQDSRTIIGQHPEDFKLFVIGDYDASKGIISSSNRVCLSVGTDFVKSEG